MSINKTIYNCPNCAAPIEYAEICPHCDTPIVWEPMLKSSGRIHRRIVKPCVAFFLEYPHSGLEREFIDKCLQEQIGKAASEIWTRMERPNNDMMNSILPGPPDATIHSAKVCFSVLMPSDDEE